MDVKEAQALVRLIAGQTPSQVAESMGVARNTVHRWASDSEFKQEMGKASNRLFDAAIAELSLVATEAASQLAAIVRDPDVRTSDRLKAIQMIFDNLHRVRELNLDSRLERLERAVDENAIEVEVGTIREKISIEGQS